MIWSTVAHVFSILLELIHIGRMSDLDKDLKILVLRYQLGIADRKLNTWTTTIRDGHTKV